MKNQLILAASGILLVFVLIFFGKTTGKKESPANQPSTSVIKFDIQDEITKTKQKLTPSQSASLAKLENNITRGDVPTQQIAAFNNIAGFWKDSLQMDDPYIYYTSEAAKLENSEKTLTFAAQLFLDNLRSETDIAKVDWKSGIAIELFEKALKGNPENTDLKIGLASCYIYGRGRNGNPQETMQGIQQLLAVVKMDSSNMKAQLVLGIGGLVSGQFDKAIDRLQKVVNSQPDNLEAVLYLADAYAAKRDKTNAIKWYNMGKRLRNDPAFTRELDEHIKQLK